jgi:polyvinyl alcohol dehydrogenase (cytochrome)
MKNILQNFPIKSFFIFCLAMSFIPINSYAANCDKAVYVDNVAVGSWGFTANNARAVYENSKINSNTISKLKKSWVFNLGEGEMHHSQPVITNDSIIIGTQHGALIALDRRSGCERWRFQADGDIRTAIVLGDKNNDQASLFFGTSEASVYAVSVRDGQLQWRQRVVEHPAATVTGSPLYYEGRLYVPVSSGEVIKAAWPFYACCTFRGGVQAFDAKNGKPLWRYDTIDEIATKRGSHYGFVDEFGPSGAPVWSAPALDIEQGLLYVGTGQNYSAPSTLTSDAIHAIDIKTGQRRWVKQFTANDAWNVACELPIKANCPKDTQHHDFDFGAPPIIATLLDNQKIILAGQKSSAVYGLDPLTGELRWQKILGLGGKLGGVHWGMAFDQHTGLLIVPISDRPDKFFDKSLSDKMRPGLFALDAKTGEQRWYKAIDKNVCGDREGCYAGNSAAITISNDLVFAGGLDGVLRAHRISDGEILWEDNTWGEHTAVNEKTAKGAALDVHGPVVADDQLIITSGYGTFMQEGGNALIVYALEM